MVTIAGKIIATIALAAFAKSSCALGLNDIFSDPEIGIYTDKSILPRGYVVVDGIWHDNRGKALAEPKVNFAGKYWVTLHSCGPECRYYSMLDLSTGTESRALDMFSTTEPHRKRVTENYISLAWKLVLRASYWLLSIT